MITLSAAAKALSVIIPRDGIQSISFYPPERKIFKNFFGARKKPLIHSETSGMICGVFS